VIVDDQNPHAALKTASKGYFSIMPGASCDHAGKPPSVRCFCFRGAAAALALAGHLDDLPGDVTRTAWRHGDPRVGPSAKGRAVMRMRAAIMVALSLAPAAVPDVALAQAPAPIYSRVIDLTLPIPGTMAAIPGLKLFADNPPRIDVVAAMTEAQRTQLRAEGLRVSDTAEINGRVMISLVSILTHSGTHIDAPRHVLESGMAVDRIPLAQVVREGVLIDMTHKGANTSISVQDILGTGVALGPDRIPVIHTGWTDKM
jgi:hypothetical protein